MPANATREDVQRLLREGAQVVDPLAEDEYAEEHLPGAVNIPMRRLNREATAHLDKRRPVIVYCFDLD